METLDPPDGTERECEAVTARPAAVCLAGVGGGGGTAGRLQEAGGGCGKTEISLGEVESAGIVKTPIAIFIALGHVGGRYGQLGGDLVEGVLARGEAELVLEQGGFGRVFVGVGQGEALDGFQQLLGLLHKIGEVQHGL